MACFAASPSFPPVLGLRGSRLAGLDWNGIGVMQLCPCRAFILLSEHVLRISVRMMVMLNTDVARMRIVGVPLKVGVDRASLLQVATT